MILEFIRGLFVKKLKPRPHVHDWVVQYRTGHAVDGKSTVVKCDCGQWAVRHYGAKEYVLIDSK